MKQTKYRISFTDGSVVELWAWNEKEAIVEATEHQLAMNKSTEFSGNSSYYDRHNEHWVPVSMNVETKVAHTPELSVYESDLLKALRLMVREFEPPSPQDEYQYLPEQLKAIEEARLALSIYREVQL